MRLTQNTIGDRIFAGSRSIEIFVPRTIRSLTVHYARMTDRANRGTVRAFSFDWSCDVSRNLTFWLNERIMYDKRIN